MYSCGLWRVSWRAGMTPRIAEAALFGAWLLLAVVVVFMR
jgi:hypothetical protein